MVSRLCAGLAFVAIFATGLYAVIFFEVTHERPSAVPYAAYGGPSRNASASCPPCPAAQPAPPCPQLQPQQPPEQTPAVQQPPQKAPGAGFCQGGIARIVHQSWKTTDLPSWSKNLSATWLQVHSAARGWRHMIHTDEDNRQILARNFPWALETYDKTYTINKVDMVRAAYLYEYGGVYADLDAQALLPLDDFMEKACAEGKPVILGRMDRPGEGDHEHAVPNALMISARPGEPFWPYCARQWIKNIARGCFQAEWCAGPVALRNCLESWAKVHDIDPQKSMLTSNPAPNVLLVREGILYPHSWMYQGNIKSCVQKTLDVEECKKKIDLSKALTIVYWRHSWGRKRSLYEEAEAEELQQQQ